MLNNWKKSRKFILTIKSICDAKILLRFLYQKVQKKFCFLYYFGVVALPDGATLLIQTAKKSHFFRKILFIVPDGVAFYCLCEKIETVEYYPLFYVENFYGKVCLEKYPNESVWGFRCWKLCVIRLGWVGWDFILFMMASFIDFLFRCSFSISSDWEIRLLWVT